jgi:hypothetical protein
MNSTKQSAQSSTLSIYIYDLPAKFHHELESKCSIDSSMFATEILIHRWLEIHSIRTYDPKEASLFFLPVYSTCALMLAGRESRTVVPNPHLVQRSLIKDALEWVKVHHSQHWNRHQGSDHVLILPHDFGACLWHRDLSPSLWNAQKSVHPELEDLMHMLVLSPFSSLSSPCFNRSWHVSIPPHIPTAQAFLKSHDRVRPKQPSPDWSAVFRGTFEWNWMGRPDPNYSQGIRQKLASYYGLDHPHIRIKRRKDSDLYLLEMQQATFCICPRGYAPWTPLLTESLAVGGCVPVVIADNCLPPFSDFLPWYDIAIFVPQEVSIVTSTSLAHVLATYAANHSNMQALQASGSIYWHNLLYRNDDSRKRESAYDFLLHSFELRARQLPQLG